MNETAKIIDLPPLIMEEKIPTIESSTADSSSIFSFGTIPFIVYIALSTIIIFGFLIKIIDPIETLVYFLLQALFIVIIGSIIYWMCTKDAQIWAWSLLVIAIIIQILWILFTVYY